MITTPGVHPQVNKYSRFRTIGIPREGKKLAIINADNTIMDPNAFFFDERPYLRKFLGKLYENYDIGLWSISSMDTLYSLMYKLHLDGPPGYKILFYSILHETIQIPRSQNMFEVKRLDAVWDMFPEHSQAKTVLCDHNPENFILYPRNGILMSSYNASHYEEDDELLQLIPYLQYVAKFDNVMQIDHRDWKSCIVANY